MNKEKKRDVRVGICSPYFRPQKYEVRDPFPDVPFSKKGRPSYGVRIIYGLIVGIMVAYFFGVL